MADLRTIERESLNPRRLSLREIAEVTGYSKSRIHQLEDLGEIVGRSWWSVAQFATSRRLDARLLFERWSVELATEYQDAVAGIRWRRLVGLYEVSTAGQIRYGPSRNVLARSKVGRTKYLQAILRLPNGSRNYLVHRAVLEAFVGPCPPGMQSRHLNGNERDNSLENLAWGTPKENAQDKHRHGTTVRGEVSPNAKLTDDVVREIRQRSESQRKLAKRFGVCQTTIRYVQQGRIWSHVESP